MRRKSTSVRSMGTHVSTAESALTRSTGIAATALKVTTTTSARVTSITAPLGHVSMVYARTEPTRTLVNVNLVTRVVTASYRRTTVQAIHVSTGQRVTARLDTIPVPALPDIMVGESHVVLKKIEVF